ncbi:parkin coregulated gene protein [Cyclospora cayetanensis]|nr:parkin coregulated gene protein [Cyclospora cayetanensis]
MATTLKVIQKLLITGPQAGEALVPYYRQLLPCFNLFISKRKNLGSGIDYAQRRREDVAVLIEETLKMLEETGGPDAFINIKYMVPIYESQVLTGR